MNHPMTASIIFVQLEEGSEVVAYVAYGPSGDKQKTVRVELQLGTMSDATDMQMWMQMCAASVCDEL